MAVVAVLLIHMDKKAVTPMKPNIRLSASARKQYISDLELEDGVLRVLQQPDTNEDN